MCEISFILRTDINGSCRTCTRNSVYNVDNNFPGATEDGRTAVEVCEERLGLDALLAF